MAGEASGWGLRRLVRDPHGPGRNDFFQQGVIMSGIRNWLVMAAMLSGWSVAGVCSAADKVYVANEEADTVSVLDAA